MSSQAVWYIRVNPYPRHPIWTGCQKQSIVFVSGVSLNNVLILSVLVCCWIELSCFLTISKLFLSSPRSFIQCQQNVPTKATMERVFVHSQNPRTQQKRSFPLNERSTETAKTRSLQSYISYILTTPWLMNPTETLFGKSRASSGPSSIAPLRKLRFFES